MTINQSKENGDKQQLHDDIDKCIVCSEKWHMLYSVWRKRNAYTHETETTVDIVDAELHTVTPYFKYIGSLFTSEGGSQADVNNRMDEVEGSIRGDVQ